MHAHVKIEGIAFGEASRRKFTFETIMTAPHGETTILGFVHRLERFNQWLSQLRMTLTVTSISTDRSPDMDGSEAGQAKRMRDEAALAQVILELGLKMKDDD